MLRLIALTIVAVRVLVTLARLDIFDWISGAFNTITSIPGDVVQTIWQAIKGVGDFFGRINELANAAWDWMINGVEWLGSRAAWAAGAAFNTISWVVTRWVPMAAHWALGKAVAYAIGALKQLEKWAATLVSDAVRFLRGLINTVENWARSAFRLITGEISKILKWLAAAGNYVFGILAHPARLVSWIIPDLLTPLIKFAVASSAPVIRWLIGAFVHLAPELATTLEDAIAKIL